MRILLADDDPIFRKLNSRVLESHGHEIVLANDGDEAWQALGRPEAPRLAILDWMMPGIEGVELCRRLRRTARHSLSYLIVVTSRSSTVDLVEALDAGANDFISKPYEMAEFLARVEAGVRSLKRQDALLERLAGFLFLTSDDFRGMSVLPVCMYCMSVRDRSDQWHEREVLSSRATTVQISHGICPECECGIVMPMLDQMRQEAPDALGDGDTGD